MSGWVKMNPADFGDGDKGDLWLKHPNRGAGYRIAGAEFVEHAPHSGRSGWVYGAGYFLEGNFIEEHGWTITHWRPEPDAPEGAA